MNMTSSNVPIPKFKPIMWNEDVIVDNNGLSPNEWNQTIFWEDFFGKKINQNDTAFKRKSVFTCYMYTVE